MGVGGLNEYMDVTYMRRLAMSSAYAMPRSPERLALRSRRFARPKSKTPRRVQTS